MTSQEDAQGFHSFTGQLHRALTTFRRFPLLSLISEGQGGEGIPAATVDDPSSFTIRAFAGNTSASDLTVGGGTAVRNVHVEAPYFICWYRRSSWNLIRFGGCRRGDQLFLFL